MDIKKAGIIAIIILIASAGLITYAYSIRPIENLYNVNVDNVSFKTHYNVSDLHIYRSENGGIQYSSDNEFLDLYVCDYNSKMSNDVDYTLKYQCSNPTDVNGHVVYLSSSNVGDHAGETRYVSVINDRDNKRVIAVSCPDKNEASYILDNVTVAK